MIFCSFINGIHPSTHVFTHMFPPRGSYDRLCRAVATLLRPHWLGRGLGGPLPPGAGLSGVPRAPVSSTLCPATRKLSLKHRANHGLSCSQPSQGSSCSCDKARCPGVCPGNSGPPFHPVSGSQPPPFTAVLRMDSGLKHRAQPRHFRALSVSLHVSLFFSLSPWSWGLCWSPPCFPLC